MKKGVSAQFPVVVTVSVLLVVLIALIFLSNTKSPQIPVLSTSTRTSRPLSTRTPVPQLTPTRTQTPTAYSGGVPTEPNYPEVPRVSPVDAKTAFDAKTAVFVDVRNNASFVVSHIPGALSIEVKDLESNMGSLNKEDWIITYCT
jgi:hypothetical protein